MLQLFAVQHAWLIPLLPLMAAAMVGLLGAKILRGQSHWLIWLAVGASAVISLSLLFGMIDLWRHGQNLAVGAHWYTWIEAGSFRAEAGAWIDPLTAVMLCVVTGVGFFIIVYAKGYMAGETGYFRFFAYLGLFIFAMTMLVLADNFIMLYLGWEGVGLCSYLLIGYYYDKPSAVQAAKKAFLVNRVGDFGFGLGIMLIFKAFGTVSYFGDAAHPGVLMLATHPTLAQADAMRYIPFLLMLGAFGKSAQFPLYVWLPDAMEGPTPVSALIHAATMVTAGVYMIARCSTLFVQNDAAMLTIACIGVFTALFAATIALRQWDLKKVFAYSTISQLGYMFAAVGVLAPTAAVFHLVTHAFFKALLFLCCGVVMHAMAGELDMRKMSGLKRVLPWTRWFILIGCAALSGVPFLSGFFSKDDIVAAALDRHVILGLLLLLTSFLTAYYTFRLYFQVFEGPLVVPPPPEDAHGASHHDEPHKEHSHNHEPLIMMLPLAVLTLGAILIGYVNWPSRAGDLSAFLGQSPSLSLGFKLAPSDVDPDAFGQPLPKSAVMGSPITPMMLIGGAVAVAGIMLAYWLHLKDRPRAQKVADAFQPLTDAIEHKYWVDEIYQAAIVEPLRKLGGLFFAIDEFIIDGIVAVIGFIPQLGGFALKFSTQRGYLQGYAATMLIGIVAILVLVFVF